MYCTAGEVRLWSEALQGPVSMAVVTFLCLTCKATRMAPMNQMHEAVSPVSRTTPALLANWSAN